MTSPGSFSAYVRFCQLFVQVCQGAGETTGGARRVKGTPTFTSFALNVSCNVDPVAGGGGADCFLELLVVSVCDRM